MEKYISLLQIKPPHLQSQYLTEMVNKSDIVFTHKTLELEFVKEKNMLAATEAKKENKGIKKKGGATITLVF